MEQHAPLAPASPTQLTSAREAAFETPLGKKKKVKLKPKRKMQTARSVISLSQSLDAKAGQAWGNSEDALMMTPSPEEKNSGESNNSFDFTTTAPIARTVLKSLHDSAIDGALGGMPSKEQKSDQAILDARLRDKSLYRTARDLADLGQLLDARADPNADACKDESGATPLHLAVKANNRKAVVALVASGADTEICDSHGLTALDQAIDWQLHDMVKDLVENGAILVGSRGGDSTASSTPQPMPHVDLLFEVGNDIVTACAALGLKKQPQQVKNLRQLDLVRFLRSSGKAPIYILDAIFEERSLNFIAEKKKGGILHEIPVAIDTAYTSMGALNVAEGHAYQKWDERYEARDHDFFGLRESKAFLRHLAPQQENSEASTQFPVKLMQCLLPNMQENVMILAAIARTRSPEIFDSMACKAIVKLAWKKVAKFAFAEICLNFVNVIVLTCLTASMHGALNTSTEFWAVLEFIPWFYNWLLEIVQMVSWISMGMSGVYFSSVGNWFDHVRSLNAVVVNVLIIAWGGDVFKESYFVCLFAARVWSAWMRLLFTLRVFKTIGRRMLPILHATADISSFCVVLVFNMCAFTHAYYALGMRDAGEAIMIMFRLAVMGDFDVYEMENVDGTYVQNQVKLDTWDETDPEPSKWRLPVQVLLLISGFWMTVTLMNIFIGVLSVSYEQFTEKSERLFYMTRAEAIMSHVSGLSGFWNQLRGSEVNVGKEPAFLWYSVCREDEDSSDEEDREATRKDVREMKEQLQSLFDEVKSISSQLNSLSAKSSF